MSVLNVSGLNKYFGERGLLENVSFSVEANDKIGLIGKNGAGKTTLFKILLGEMNHDGGQIVFARGTNVGHLSQFVTNDTHRTLWDELLLSFEPLMKLEAELEELTLRMSDESLSDDEREKIISRHARMHEDFVNRGGLYYKSRVSATLRGLGFSEEDFSRTLNTLSGGQLSKLELSKLLLSESTLLLLDEPTNHLDIEAIEWLEDFLRNYSGAFIVISHDRYFLDRVTTKTMEIERGRVTLVSMPYTRYIEHKEGEEEYTLRRYENTMREIRRIEGIVKQQRQWNRERNIKTAESKLKQIERMKATLVVPESKEKHLKFSFAPAKRGSSEALVVQDVSISFDGAKIIDNVSFDLADAERVFLLGRNGSGKTTLVRAIMDKIPYDGEIKTGVSCDVAYYDQLGRTIRGGCDVITEVWDDFPTLTQTDVRNALAAFLFAGDDVFKSIDELSGGERARIALLKVMLKGANFLILDEPTNHLDIYSKEALEDALLNYEGTMVVISHDRYFINKLSDRILYLEGGHLTDFTGNYDEFSQSRRENPVQTEKAEKKSDAKAEFQRKKELQSQIRSLNTKIKRAEDNIADIEAKLEEAQAMLSDESISSDYKKMMEITELQQELNEKLEAAYSEWEELSEKLLEISEG